MFFLSRNQIDRVKGRLLESPLGKKENKTGEMFLDIHDFMSTILVSTVFYLFAMHLLVHV